MDECGKLSVVYWGEFAYLGRYLCLRQGNVHVVKLYAYFASCINLQLQVLYLAVQCSAV